MDRAALDYAIAVPAVANGRDAAGYHDPSLTGEQAVAEFRAGPTCSLYPIGHDGYGDMPLDHTKIRAERERRNLTQTEAAVRAGMPRAHWSRLESGRRPDPLLSTAESVAAALRCPLTKLLTDDRTP